MNQTEALIELAKAAGLKVEKYSGRGMMGRFCPSISCERTVAFAAFELGEKLVEMSDEIQDALVGLKVHMLNAASDNLGYDKLLYFPTITWEEPDVKEDVEE